MFIVDKLKDKSVLKTFQLEIKVTLNHYFAKQEEQRVRFM